MQMQFFFNSEVPIDRFGNYLFGLEIFQKDDILTRLE